MIHNTLAAYKFIRVHCLMSVVFGTVLSSQKSFKKLTNKRDATMSAARRIVFDKSGQALFACMA